MECHANIVASYARTGMARSISTPGTEAQLDRVWLHAPSGRQFAVRAERGKLVHRVSAASYPLEYAIGSGNQGKSYLHRIGDSLFQSPLAWYTERRLWDMSPGYFEDSAPDFYRPVTSECLFCHVGEARPIAGTQNRYFDAPISGPIGCNRCHGDAENHDGLVIPSKLANAVRDSICESCHLTGVARILNPGREFSDFKPGMQLEEVFTVYVEPAASSALKVVSHSEQLATSKCATGSSGRMWCATCHDPHREPAPQEKLAWYRAKCLSCHPASHRKEEDCAACHMPRIKPYDGGHTAFTDHRVRASNTIQSGESLRAWREPPKPFRTRNLALALIASAQSSKSLERYREGVSLLNQVAGAPHVDGGVSIVVGLQFMRQNQPAKAVPWFRRALSEKPNSSLWRLSLAAALAGAGDSNAARTEAEAVMRAEPLLEDTYKLLAEIEPARAVYWWGRYRKLLPKRAQR